MQRSIDDLWASGIMNRIVKVGQPAPGFALPNAAAAGRRPPELLVRGPVALTFYRGRW